MVTVNQQAAPVQLRGWRLEYVASNYDAGRIREVCYQTTIGETSQVYRFYITDQQTRLIYRDQLGDEQEETFSGLPEALEFMTKNEIQTAEPSQSFSDAFFLLRFRQCNEAMQKARTRDNRSWFRTRAIEYADELVSRGVFARNDKGGYVRTKQALDVHSKNLQGVK